MFFLGCVAGCARKDYQQEIMQYAATADSVSAMIWQGTTFATPTKHSPFFDSVYTYHLASFMLERDRRIWQDSVIHVIDLQVKSLADAERRKMMLRVFDADSVKQEFFRLRLDSIFLIYASFIKRVGDSVFREDSNARHLFLSRLIQLQRFQPVWRPQYDSLETAILDHERNLVRLVDTSSSDIRMDSVIRFEDPVQEATYRDLVQELEALSTKEQVILQEITTSNRLSMQK